MPDCVFCQIVQKKIPARIIFEDDVVVALLDINPGNPGHTLLVSKKHYQDFVSIQADELKKIIVDIQAVTDGIVKAVDASGFNILQNNGADAGQLIPHVHFHIVPRFKDDGLNLGVMRQQKIEAAEMDRIASKIRSSIVPPKVEEPKVEVVEQKKSTEKRRKKEETYFIRREIEKT